MIEHAYYYISDNTNPYHNQAVSAYIFEHIPDDSIVLFLYQNNQSISLPYQGSPYNTLSVGEMENDRCYLTRRETAGPILYNDLGTLNYDFFLYLNNQSTNAQINVIYQALRRLHLPVYLDEANELYLDGRCISDNVYMVKQERCLHSGCLYWDCDKTKRARLVKEISTKSTYGNITDTYPLCSLKDIKKCILQSLADGFGPVCQLSITADLLSYYERYQSPSYIYQTDKKYTLILNEHFDFGQAQIYVDMLRNKILKMDIYMSEENDEIADMIKNVFEGKCVDDAIFKDSLDKTDGAHKDDLYKIYRTIKKEGYRL